MPDIVITPSLTSPSNEFTVNSETSLDQVNSKAVALEGGGFVVVWYSSDNDVDGSGRGVAARVYDANGVALGNEFTVNTLASGDQLHADVEALSGGGFIVVWHSADPAVDGSGSGIAAQMFDAAGTKVGVEFTVNTEVAGNQSLPEVTALTNGGIVVTWESADVDVDGNGTRISGQLYNSSGAKVGGEFTVNTNAVGNQSFATSAALEGGGFVVTWYSADPAVDGSGFGIAAQVFSNDGTKVGSEFTVNTNSAGDQLIPHVAALDGGGFVVVWYGGNSPSDANGQGISGQRFDANATKVGSEFTINTNTTGDQFFPKAAPLDGGGFVVTWRSDSAPGDASSSGVSGQIFDSTDAKVDGEFLVNTNTSNGQFNRGLASLGDHQFVVAFQSSDTSVDGSGSGIAARVFNVSASALNVASQSADGTLTTTEDTPFTFAASNFTFTDSDAGNSLQSVRIDTLPSNAAGELQLSGMAVTAGQVITLANIPNLTFVPAADVNGTGAASFTFSVSDGTEFDATPNTITFNITGANDAPTSAGSPATVTVVEDTASGFDLSTINIADVDGDSLTVTIVISAGSFATPVDGAGVGAGVSATLVNATTITLAGSVADINTYLDTGSNIQYIGALNANGTSAATYTVNANDDVLNPQIASGNIDITAVNDAPTGANHTESLAANTPESFGTAVYTVRLTDFGFSDIDGDSFSSVRIDTLNLAIGDTFTNDNVPIQVGDIITLKDIDDGDIKYTPVDDGFGVGRTTFTFSVNDGTSFAATPSTFSFDVAQGNQSPASSNSSVSTAEDATYVFSASDFNFSDPDMGDTLGVVTISNLNLAAGDQLLYFGSAVTNGEAISLAELTNGDFTYIPAAGTSGAARSSFDFSVTDNHNRPAAAGSTLTLNVTATSVATPTTPIVTPVDNANTDGGQQSGTGMNDSLGGSGGDDTLSGGNGGDTLIGGQGADFIAGGNGNDTSFAGPGDTGNDTVQGNAGNDVIGGGGGDDIIVGGTLSTSASQSNTGNSGNDTLFGGAGNDLIVAGSYNSASMTVVNTGQGVNTAWAGTGDDTVYGDDNQDMLGGGSGGDSLDGGSGDDTIFGGSGNDSINAGGDNDTTFSGAGNDSLDGGDGDDTLFGGGGDDTVAGGAGADEIWAGAGNDDLSGGAGADTFVFGNTSGNDTVTDFDASEDILYLEFASTDFTSLADVTSAATAMTQNGQAGVLIDLGESDSVFVIGISIADLTANNVSF